MHLISARLASIYRHQEEYRPPVPCLNNHNCEDGIVRVMPVVAQRSGCHDLSREPGNRKSPALCRRRFEHSPIHLLILLPKGRLDFCFSAHRKETKTNAPLEKSPRKRLPHRHL